MSLPLAEKCNSQIIADGEGLACQEILWDLEPILIRLIADLYQILAW